MGQNTSKIDTTTHDNLSVAHEQFSKLKLLPVENLMQITLFVVEREVKLWEQEMKKT